MARFRRFLLSALSHRTLALVRWDLHLLRVRIRNALTGSDRKLMQRVSGISRPRLLNLGSGPRGLDAPNWVNVDAFPDANVHHLMDFGRKFPFADGDFDGIFSEHVLEHFTREEGITVLSECHRVLFPGGTLRVIVPDACKLFQSYFSDPDALSERRETSTSLPMEVVNLYAYQRYEHQCLYDWPLMQHTFADAGFTDITLCSFRAGAHAALTIDDPKYEWESLYVEARRKN
ncbi:MAG: methyltransferase domain-containing protein [Chthoniobacterales bacterium]|nr:methyltransferase domain-containing protein [Chthoniobacterales bacterium]